MRAGSLFSGIGGLDLGLERAGFEIVFQAESDPWRRTVLAENYYDVPCVHAVQDIDEIWLSGVGLCRERNRGRPAWPDREQGAVDLLCGGFPCQDVSVAGKRKGLAGERTGLFWEFIRVARSIRPAWILLENVPGLLSSHRGGDFATILGALAELGYGVAWRILDSRYFGVPQRRRRVFILGSLAPDDTRAAAERCAEILSVGTRCTGHSAAGAAAGQDASTPSLSGLGSGGADDNDGQAGRLVTHALTGEGHDASEDGTGRGTPLVAAPLSHGSNPNSNAAGRRREDDVNLVTGPLGGGNDGIRRRSEDDPNLVTAFYSTESMSSGNNTDICPTLRTDVGVPSIVNQGVRRLMPIECERLQGLPDNWTALGADSKRYAALGDAVTVNVAQWLGERILEHSRRDGPGGRAD